MYDTDLPRYSFFSFAMVYLWNISKNISRRCGFISARSSPLRMRFIAFVAHSGVTQKRRDGVFMAFCMASFCELISQVATMCRNALKRSVFLSLIKVLFSLMVSCFSVTKLSG